MSVASLLLFRFSDPQKLVPAAEELEHSKIVDCWNAVDGHIDLVAKVNAEPTALIERIRTLGGIGEVHVLGLVEEAGKLLCDPAFAHSFVFLEVERERLSAVREKLLNLQHIEFCSSIEGSEELVIVVSGSAFHSIDRIVEDEIRTIDGVLRLKQDRVIDLKQI
jgi:DNA-binding Lrp family transcriptional regulator